MKAFASLFSVPPNLSCSSVPGRQWRSCWRPNGASISWITEQPVCSQQVQQLDLYFLGSLKRFNQGVELKETRRNSIAKYFIYDLVIYTVMK